MNRKGINRSFILFACGVVMFFSCKSDRTGRSAKEFNDNETGEIVERIEEIKKVYNLCPSPAEMLSIIDVAEMQFKTDLLNQTVNADKYLDTRSLTVNLGIYATDLAYSALFGRHEETINYLEAVQDIADKVRVSGTINEKLVERAKNNINNIDSLSDISNEAFINMIFFCEKNDRPGTVMLISTGAFIESLYLAASMIEVYDTKSYMIQHLADQKYAIDNLMSFAASEAAVPSVNDAIELLKPLVEIFDQIQDASGSTTVKKEESGKLVVGGKSKTNLSESNFIRLKETVSKIRNDITSNRI
jgi:hypothetical protein